MVKFNNNDDFRIIGSPTKLMDEKKSFIQTKYQNTNGKLKDNLIPNVTSLTILNDVKTLQLSSRVNTSQQENFILKKSNINSIIELEDESAKFRHNFLSIISIIFILGSITSISQLPPSSDSVIIWFIMIFISIAFYSVIKKSFKLKIGYLKVVYQSDNNSSNFIILSYTKSKNNSLFIKSLINDIIKTKA